MKELRPKERTHAANASFQYFVVGESCLGELLSDSVANASEGLICGI